MAGDVFDSPAPPPEAEKLVYDFLARLRPGADRLRPDRRQPRPPAEARRARRAPREACGSTSGPRCGRPAEGGVVRLASRDGREEAAVAVLPFVPERRVVDACTVMDAEHKWYDGLRRAHRADPRRAREGPAAGHRQPRARATCWWTARASGTGERELHLGQVYGVNPQQLPSSVQYIGLGHLHRPQEVLAPAKTLYAGSLDRARLRRAGAGEARRRARGEGPAGRSRIESVPAHRGPTAARRGGHARRAAALSAEAGRRLPARDGEGRRPGARPRRPGQGAAPERPRRHGRPPARRRRRAAGARQGPGRSSPPPSSSPPTTSTATRPRRRRSCGSSSTSSTRRRTK